MLYQQYFPVWMLPFMWLIVVLAIWELIWKGIALWKAARNSHTGWYIAILILNTAGILPIIYILLFSKEKRKRR